MKKLATQLIENQIIEILEVANRRAQVLRDLGYAREADKEFATAILTALILVRAYCWYGYLEKSVCLELDKLLGLTLAIYITTYKIEAEDSLVSQVYSLWKHQNEELVTLPA